MDYLFFTGILIVTGCTLQHRFSQALMYLPSMQDDKTTKRTMIGCPCNANSRKEHIPQLIQEAIPQKNPFFDRYEK